MFGEEKEGLMAASRGARKRAAGDKAAGGRLSHTGLWRGRLAQVLTVGSWFVGIELTG